MSVSLRVAKLYDFPKMKFSMLLHFIFALGIVSSSSTVCASCECEELLHPVSNYTVAMPSSKSPALRARAKKSSKRASKSKPNTKKSDQKPSKAAAKPKVEVGKGPKQNVEPPFIYQIQYLCAPLASRAMGIMRRSCFQTTCL